jgi:hypothetical protein
MERQPALISPVRGMDHGVRSGVVGQGLLARELNTCYSRRASARRPFRTRFNHTAVGAPGFQLRRNAYIPYHPALCGYEASKLVTNVYTWEFTFRWDFDIPGSGIKRFPILFQSSRAAEVADYTGTTKNRITDSPFVLNLYRDGSDDMFFELFIVTSTGTQRRLVVPAKRNLRQHVSVKYDSATDCKLRVDDDGTGSEAEASVGSAPGLMQDLRMKWNLRGPVEGIGGNKQTWDYFEFEGLRCWNEYRSDSELAAYQEQIVNPNSANLVGQWTGLRGTEDHIANEAAIDLPIFFEANYPSYYAGALGRGMAILNADRQIPSMFANMRKANPNDYLYKEYVVSRDALDDVSGAFRNAGASGDLEYGQRVRFRILSRNNLDASGTRTLLGILSGQFELYWDQSTGKFSAIDVNVPAVIITSVNPFEPGESHVVSVYRDGGSLFMHVNGVMEANSGALGTAAASLLQDAKLGLSTATTGVGGDVIIEEFTAWYGNPTTSSANLFDRVDRFKDSLEEGVYGNDIVEHIGGGFVVTAAGTTVACAKAQFTPRKGDFLVRMDKNYRRMAFCVTSVVGTNATIHPAWPATEASGEAVFAVTRALAHHRFDSPWSTESNQTICTYDSAATRLGNQRYLAQHIDDEQQVMQPLWLENGVNSISANDILRNVEAERTRRFAGHMQFTDLPCRGSLGYRKEEFEGLLAVFGRSLYWMHDGWTRNVQLDRAPNHHLLSFGQGALYGADARLYDCFESGDFTGDFEFEADIRPEIVEDKRAIFWCGSGEGARRLGFYINAGKLRCDLWYDTGGPEIRMTLETDVPVVFRGEYSRVKLFIDANNVGNSFIAVNGHEHEVTASGTGTWPTGGEVPATVAANAYGLLGMSPVAPDRDGRADGVKDFVGYCAQVKVADAAGSSVNQAIEAHLDSTDASCLLTMAEGSGWVLANEGTGANAINGHPGWAEIRGDLPECAGNDLWSMAQYRGKAFGTCVGGRGFVAEWTGDFENDAFGWDTSKSGITAPKHKPRVELTGTTVGCNFTGDGDYLFCYVYRAKDGTRSNPSQFVMMTQPAHPETVFLDDIAGSEDPRVDSIEVYGSTTNGGEPRLVKSIPNGAAGVELNYVDATALGGEGVSLDNNVPPASRYVAFLLDRAYYGYLPGAPGAVWVSQANKEQSMGVDVFQADGKRWSEVTALRAHRGALMIHTSGGDIFRLVPGGGSLDTFNKTVANSGGAARSQQSILAIDGLDVWPGLESILGYDGSRTIPIGQSVEMDLSGDGAWGGNQIDEYSHLNCSAWDRRRQIGFMFYRPFGGSGKTGKAVILSRRPGSEQPLLSLADMGDVSYAVAYEDSFARPQLGVFDSWGYFWRLDDPTAWTDDAIDLDGLGAADEAGSARALTGDVGVDDMVPHLAGDGMRGYPVLLIDRNSDGKPTSWRHDRLLRTPASTTPLAAEWEGGVSATEDEWRLGHFEQSWELAWTPRGFYMLPKKGGHMDWIFSPVAGEEALLKFYAASGGIGDRAMVTRISEASATSKYVSLEDGFLDGVDLGADGRGRAWIASFTYLGSKPLELYEAGMIWVPEGAMLGGSNA